jgi:ribosome maturation factor RimP
VNLEKIREAAERVARSEGLEIADVEWKVGKQRFLRVSIDRVPPGLSEAAGGALRQDSGQASAAPTETPAKEAATAGGGYAAISHADCERVSKQLSVILDVEELLPGPGYVLEVSSPGLDRALKKPGDFERFKGRLAKISTAEPIGEAKFFEGRLAGFADGKVRMELQGREARVVEVPLETIRKANLVVEF